MMCRVTHLPTLMLVARPDPTLMIKCRHDTPMSEILPDVTNTCDTPTE
jgi:hypothetical protein